MATSRPIRLLQFLAAFGLLSVTPARADQVVDFTYSDNGAGWRLDHYTGAGGAVVIPASIDGTPVTEIGDNALRNRSDLTSVTIPNSVTSIGYEAFGNCSGLTSVTIPSSVTSIRDVAFWNAVA